MRARSDLSAAGSDLLMALILSHGADTETAPAGSGIVPSRGALRARSSGRRRSARLAPIPSRAPCDLL